MSKIKLSNIFLLGCTVLIIIAYLIDSSTTHVYGTSDLPIIILVFSSIASFFVGLICKLIELKRPKENIPSENIWARGTIGNVSLIIWLCIVVLALFKIAGLH